MKLTDKCKDDFEEWLKDNYHEYDFYNIMEWWEHIFSMQYGLYVDFFDSVGINIKCNGYSLGREYDRTFKYEVTNEMSSIIKDYEGGCFDTRYEARKRALEKANEIYNKTK
jgi:hypothetical protein